MNREECPKVSIIIPVYNGANYVKYAIESALAQTYKNLEIIVVNDGSTDKTEEVVKQFGKKVRYYRKENGGVSTALNFAIEKMEGEYFSWLSHDDTYYPEKVEKQVEYLLENNLRGKKIILYSDYSLINTKGEKIADCVKDHDELELKPEYALLKGNINGLSLLIPKKAFEECGNFDTKLRCVQDYELWRIMSKKYKFIHLPEILVSTRYHAKQVSNTSPLVVTEGNVFYKKLMDEVSDKRKIELEGSLYCFYEEMKNFYHGTPYREIEDFCTEQMQKILTEVHDEDLEKYKVSVIIPFYNRTEKLQRAIKSVQNQTHKNLELILIDDCSTVDQTKIYEIAKKNDNISIIKNAKCFGPSVGRNKGIKAATGDYIAFLDSDDEFVPEKITKMLRYAVASNANFLHSSYMREENGTETIMHSGEDYGHVGRKFIYNCRIATPTVMVKRSWFQENNFSFNENVQIGEDTILWLTIMKNNTYLIGIDEPLTIVHVGKNASAYSDKKQIIGLKNIIKYLMSDTYYSQFDNELAQIMEAYAVYVKKNNPNYIGDGMISKFFYFYKTEGLKNALKRTANKFIKKH